MKSTYIWVVSSILLLIAGDSSVRASALYSSSSEATLTFLNSPINTVISTNTRAGNDITTTENNFGTDGIPKATFNLNVNDNSSIQSGESLQALSMVDGFSPPFSQGTAQTTIGVFFENFSNEEVVFQMSFSYDLTAETNLENIALDSSFTNADFNANFGYGLLPGGETPPEVPIENISDRVISNESPVNVDTLISFPVPALTLGAVSFTTTTNGFSDTLTESVPEPSSILSLLGFAGLGITSIIKSVTNLKPDKR